MPLARSKGPLISAVEGVFFPMIAAPSTRRLHITCVVTRTVLLRAGRPHAIRARVPGSIWVPPRHDRAPGEQRIRSQESATGSSRDRRSP